MAPLVSILIPAYNAQEWIADTLRSALAQTWQAKEIIVVDDGSKDNTLEVARRFEPEGVRVVAQENQGAAAARNKAFLLSRGDYIQWLDADDILAIDKVASQMKALEGYNSHTVLSGSWGQFMYRYNRARFVRDALWCDLSPAEWLIRKMGQNLYMPNAAWLVSRELTERAGPWDPSLHVDDDGEYFCRVLLQSDKVLFVPQARMYYRISGGSSVSHIGLSNKKLDAQMRSLKRHIQYLRQLEDSSRAREACIAFLQTWLVYFYPERRDLVADSLEMAQELGGELARPRLSWKYAWIASLFGWKLAKRARLFSPQIRMLLKMRWEKVRFQIQSRFEPQTLPSSAE